MRQDRQGLSGSARSEGCAAVIDRQREEGWTEAGIDRIKEA